ncbi:hypothetical protein GWI33_017599 [Rhynchophorus ferrugineus]|uniref:Uncharacterized protein n=1 Tax=Rhynchophorus ferrugineus TaxID=354439 RepID=A0A834HXU3_RHYFE|nr:hypothetical protein GWI33_017599 [Rhynchophorus ferrugineus]
MKGRVPPSFPATTPPARLSLALWRHNAAHKATPGTSPQSKLNFGDVANGPNRLSSRPDCFRTERDSVSVNEGRGW